MRGRALLSGEIPGDPAEGLRIVASFAQSGNTLAMMDLGRAMRDGKPIPRDREAARRWLENAMRAGGLGVKAVLALMLYADTTLPTPVSRYVFPHLTVPSIGHR